MSHKLLKTELSILEKSFPRNDGCFQIILAAPEELVCRFLDSKGDRYNLQCNISVSLTAASHFKYVETYPVYIFIKTHD